MGFKARVWGVSEWGRGGDWCGWMDGAVVVLFEAFGCGMGWGGVFSLVAKSGLVDGWRCRGEEYMITVVRLHMFLKMGMREEGGIYLYIDSLHFCQEGGLMAMESFIWKQYSKL